MQLMGFCARTIEWVRDRSLADVCGCTGERCDSVGCFHKAWVVCFSLLIGAGVSDIFIPIFWAVTLICN